MFESVLFNAEVVFTIHTFIHSSHIIDVQGKWNNTVSYAISVVPSWWNMSEWYLEHVKLGKWSAIMVASVTKLVMHMKEKWLIAKKVILDLCFAYPFCSVCFSHYINSVDAYSNLENFLLLAWWWSKCKIIL